MAEPVQLKTDLPEPFTFSQSSLQDYVDCARRFQLRYIERLQWPAVETAPVLENERRQLEGQQFHRMLHQHFIGLPTENLAAMANTPDLSRWWGNFLAHGPRLDGFKLYPEISLAAPIGRHRLVAKYDLVAISPDQALIFDWKTYHKRTRDEWMAARLQTRVYSALLVVAGTHLNEKQPISPARVGMEYWYADFPGDPARFSYDATQHKRNWEGLEKLVGELGAKQSFPMTDDEKKCAFCPYRSYCNRGGAAGELLDNETELDVLNIDIEQIQEIEF